MFYSWKWLGDLKQRDGGFTLSVGGEEDVRYTAILNVYFYAADNSSGAYCAMVIISLLNLPIDLPSTSAARIKVEDTLITRLPEYLSQCKIYHG